jgi:hypothetical protein
MSRIVQFTRYGAPEVLEFKDIQIPAPADHEVRIKVKAIGLNRAESMWRKDEYVEEVRLPARLGYEIAGAARRNRNWKMALRDRRPKLAPQRPKRQKLPVRDWGAPA